MKKVNFSKVLLVIGFLLSVCFILGSVYDCYRYYRGEYQYSSSPLYLYIMAQALVFLLPGIICIVIAYVIKPKHSK